MSGNDEKKSESESAFKRYPELYENDEVIKRQMEMISESLAACKRMSKRRSPKKEVDEVVIQEVESSTDARRQYHGLPDVRDESSPVVSYILREKNESIHEILEERLHSLSSPKTSSSVPEVSQSSNNSQIGIYKPEEVDPTKMLKVIERELNVLLKMAPVLTSTVNELFSTIFHYQSCSKCKAKIRSSLPWILKTVQELVKHVTKKRLGTYVWPNELSYLRLQSVHSLEKGSLDIEEVEEDKKPEVVLGKLEKVDAIIASDAKPGLQIELEVRPEKAEKKFLERRVRFREDFEENLEKRYPTVSPKESSYNFLLQVERPRRPPEVSWTVKRSVWVSKGFASAVLFLQRFTCLRILSGFVSVPVSWVTYQLERRSNGVEYGEARLQVETMKELEAEVKGLKDLIMEVHTNQVELSNVLMEKGVSSQTIVRLTDPKMLEEENEVVRKASMMEGNQEAGSTEMLQRTVDDLKRKCAVKNKMIVTLLKGLRADVPNEWWEELVDYVFTDSKSNEGSEPDKVAELLRQMSANRQNKKVHVGPMSMMQEEEKPLEEEGERKWKEKPEVEWNVLFEDLLSTTNKGVPASTDPDVLSSSLRGPLNFFTFPASLEFDSKPEVMIKKLENQVSLLNAENDRLWNEVNDLRTLVRSSMEESSEMENVNNRSSRGLSEKIKTSGKTINLTIQIGDKDVRHSSRGKAKNPTVEEWYLERGKSKSSPVVKCTTKDCDIFPETGPRSNLSEHERNLQQKILTDTRYQYHAKSNRNRSDIDLTSLEDTSPAILNYVRKEENEPLRNYLREKIESVHHIMVATPRPSQHDFKFQSNVSEPGPSNGNGNRRFNLTNLFLKPSVIQLVDKQSQYLTAAGANVANERELQTIPENDSTFSTTSDSSQSVDQALQILRAKVKSIYKDVSVLKLKNDRLNKLLDRLLGDTIENSESFKEIDDQVNGLRERQL